MKTPNIVMFLNIGVGSAPKKQAEATTQKFAEYIKTAINAEETGIQLIACPCTGMVGINAQVIPLKAMLDGQYVMKEDIKLPEVDVLLDTLRNLADAAEVLAPEMTPSPEEREHPGVPIRETD